MYIFCSTFGLTGNQDQIFQARNNQLRKLLRLALIMENAYSQTYQFFTSISVLRYVHFLISIWGKFQKCNVNLTSYIRINFYIYI